MKKKEWVYIGIIFAVFIMLIVFQYNKKEPVTWNLTLANNDKQPFGTYASFELFKDIFDEDIAVSRLPVYNQLTEYPNTFGNYVFIQPQFDIDKLGLSELLDFVRNGNNAFIAAERFSQNLLDSLKIQYEFTSGIESGDTTNIVDMSTRFLRKNDLVLLNNPDKVYQLKKNNSVLYFSKFDFIATTILGQTQEKSLADFIRVQYGNGYFYLNANPVAFSNYYVLNKETNKYAFTALSYLPEDLPVIWDEYSKQGRVGEEHVLREILAYPPLKWAYYIALAGIVVFVIFEGKRLQRVIPVYKPLPNKTVEFANVIGSLYYNKRNNADIALKRITYLLEFIRANYYESTANLDDNFIERITEKTGCDENLTKELFVVIRKIKQHADKDWMSDSDLLKINQLIEQFYAGAKNVGHSK